MRAQALFRMLAAALVGGVLLAPPARAGADANPPPWDVTETPNQGTRANTLHGMTALSPTEAWAAGRFVTPQWKGRTLIERWDRQAWAIAPSPNPQGVDDAQLEAVDGTAPADVWAVGDQDTCHWDGRAWSKVPGAPSFGDILCSATCPAPPLRWCGRWPACGAARTTASAMA